MAKVWINPAFKDKVPQAVKDTGIKKTKEKKIVDKRPGDKKRPKVPPRSLPQYSPPDPVLELKFLQHLKDKEIPMELELINGTKFTGKIKWFSEWSIALEPEGEKREIIFNRLQMIYYSQLKEYTLSEKEIEALPEPDVKKVEITVLQNFKDEETPLIFHLKNNVDIKGTLDWCEKLIYHVKSLDEKKDYNLYKNSIIYFERVTSQ